MEEILEKVSWNDELKLMGVAYILKGVVVLVVYDQHGELVSMNDLEIPEEFE